MAAAELSFLGKLLALCALLCHYVERVDRSIPGPNGAAGALCDWGRGKRVDFLQWEPPGQSMSVRSFTSNMITFQRTSEASACSLCHLKSLITINSTWLMTYNSEVMQHGTDYI